MKCSWKKKKRKKEKKKEKKMHIFAMDSSLSYKSVMARGESHTMIFHILPGNRVEMRGGFATKKKEHTHTYRGWLEPVVVWKNDRKYAFRWQHLVLESWNASFKIIFFQAARQPPWNSEIRAAERSTCRMRIDLAERAHSRAANA